MGRDLADDRHDFLERTSDRAGEPARTEHGAAERQQDQQERQCVVAGPLETQIDERLLDEDSPAGRRHDGRHCELRPRSNAQLVPLVTKRVRAGLGAGNDERILCDVLQRRVTRFSAGVNDSIVLIDDGDASVRQRPQALDEALELRQVERSAHDAGDCALVVEHRHDDRDDGHMRQPPEDDVGDRHLLRPHRLDEVLAIAHRR